MKSHHKILLIVIVSAFFVGCITESLPVSNEKYNSIDELNSSPATLEWDEEGVPIIDYGWMRGKYIGKRRYPVTISFTAERYYNYYLESGDPEQRQKFFNNLNWLLENRLETERYIVFPSDFDYPFYDCRAGWVSSMAQGFVLKDLVYAYNLTGDLDYLMLAKKVLGGYETEVKDGGILYIDPLDGGYWYEEYACGTKPRVLNGFYYALEGLHYYYNFTGNSKAKSLYDSGIEELKRHLHEFDSGEWTYYDLEGYPSDETYHNLHIEIMGRLYGQTGDEIFRTYSTRWQSYNFSKARYEDLVSKYHKNSLKEDGT